MKPFLAKIKKVIDNMNSLNLSPKFRDVFVGLAVGAIIAAAALFGLLHKFEFIALDTMFKLRGAGKPSANIAIVEIEDMSLETLGKWPWPRGYHAAFLQILNKYNPNSVVFDILFPERDPGGDDMLAMAAGEGDNLYLAAYFVLGENSESNSRTIRPEKRFLPYLNYEVTGKENFYNARDVTLPVDILLNASKSAVIVNSPKDVDGSTRHLPLVIEFDGKLYPTLSLYLACDYLGVDLSKVIIKRGAVILPIDNGYMHIPIDSRGRMMLNFSGPIDTFKRYSYIQLLHDYDEALKKGRKSILENLRDKIVIVGHTATGSVDLRLTPFSNLYPAVGIHATALSNIIEKNIMRGLPNAYNIVIILLMSLLLGLLVKRGQKAHVNLSIMALVFLLYAGFSYFLFIFLKIWIYTFAPLITILLCYLAISINHYETVRHQKNILENELLIARTIQQSFLPKDYPHIPFLEFAARCNPAKQIGGDLYDFVRFSDDKIGVLIGDVSGKGVPAALYMARAVSEFRTRSHFSGDPAATLESVNNSFAGEGMQKSFITMQYLIVDLKAKKFSFSNGGHNTILHFIKNTNSIEELDTEKGMPIGIIEGAEFNNKEIQFERGDALFLYSDGISEAMDKKRREFGLDRVKNTLIKRSELKAEEILTDVLNEIAKFSKGAPQHDDMTLIVIKMI